MSSALEAEILAASQPLRLPGNVEQRVLSPMAVQRLARAHDRPLWDVEAAALEADVIPLHYLRNLARFGNGGQVRLLRASVAAIGSGPALERALELLALSGVGRMRILVPDASDRTAGLEAGEALARAVRNRNASCEVTVRALSLTAGRPADELRAVDAVAACLLSAREEQLLQFACRMAGVPLVLAGIEGARAQATTILPGDPGTACVYRASHPHLSPERSADAPQDQQGPRDSQARILAGLWLAEQVTALVLGEGELLRHALAYADLETGEMARYPLRG